MRVSTILLVFFVLFVLVSPYEPKADLAVSWVLKVGILIAAIWLRIIEVRTEKAIDKMFNEKKTKPWWFP
jgi:hypothetical protein